MTEYISYSRATSKEMPFGKFEGEKLGDIPDWYLKWIRDECDNEELSSLAGRILEGP